MFNIEKFREVLKLCIGAESQISFSEKSGIRPETISRMLQAEKPNRPSKTTLKKIANVSASITSYEELLEICGYVETAQGKNDKDRALDRADANAEMMKKGFAEMTRGARLFSSLLEYVKEYEVTYGRETSSEITFSEPREYEGDQHPGAEYEAFGRISYSTWDYMYSIWIVVYFAITRGGKYLILDTAMDGKSLLDAGAAGEKTIQKYKKQGKNFEELPYVFDFKAYDGATAKERLLMAIFGDPSDEWYYETYTGIGFYTDEITGDIKEFLEKHKKTICTDAQRKKQFAKAIESDDPAGVYRDFEDDADATKGFGSLIAWIMQEEEELPFTFVEREEDMPDEKPAVMIFDDEMESTKNMDQVRSICNKFAKELGVKTYGHCHSTHKRFVDKRDVFETK